MAASNLVITVVQGAGSSATTATVTLPIPSTLTAMDESQNPNSGVSAVDSLVRTIFKAGVFQVNGVYYNSATIQSITTS